MKIKIKNERILMFFYFILFHFNQELKVLLQITQRKCRTIKKIALEINASSNKKS